MTTTKNGNRSRLPANALRVCASCKRPRGNVRKEWTPITSNDGRVIGYTCPACPTYAEPIRREVNGAGVRFYAVVGTKGQDGKRRQLTRRCDTLAAAREWVAEVREGAARSSDYSDPSRLTVRALCERWLAKRAEEVGSPGGIRAVSVNGYASSLHALLGVMGDDVAREVTPGRVESVLRTLATEGGKWGRGLSHRSVAYALGTLRQVLNYAVREGWLRTNPAALAKPPRREAGMGKRAALRWSPAELKRFRAHADTYGDGEAFAAEPWLRAGMRLTLCGLRRSEVLGLDWTRVDLDAGIVKVRASRVKTGRGRATALGPVKTDASRRTVKAESIHPGTSAALRALWLAQGRPESGLVIRDAAGEPVDPDTYSARWRALCGEVGVPVLARIHNVRHSIATALRENRTAENKAAALLGHDVDTYRRFYLVTDDDAAADAAEEAGRAFA